jgi:Uma2 family endonuclease
MGYVLERFGRERERAVARFDAFVDEGRKQPRRPERSGAADAGEAAAVRKALGNGHRVSDGVLGDEAFVARVTADARPKPRPRHYPSGTMWTCTRHDRCAARQRRDVCYAAEVSISTHRSTPPRRWFSSAEVMRMVDLGVLRPDEPVELIEGELVVVTPQGPLHASRVMALQTLLAQAYDGLASLRVQLPLDSGADSLPEPDLALVRGTPSDYAGRHPVGKDTLLVVEIAQSSLAFDRQKAAVYARMSVSEYWIVDLEHRRLELRSGPTQDGLYTSTQILSEEASVELPVIARSIGVGELLGS